MYLSFHDVTAVKLTPLVEDGRYHEVGIYSGDKQLFTLSVFWADGFEPDHEPNVPGSIILASANGTIHNVEGGYWSPEVRVLASGTKVGEMSYYGGPEGDVVDLTIFWS